MSANEPPDVGVASLAISSCDEWSQSCGPISFSVDVEGRKFNTLKEGPREDAAAGGTRTPARQML